ncbi:MAG: ribosomal protein S18-alanine N-acetyltransferase [Nesterenkonia sp.]|nr:ribosomal protein S18-alanine N-acetyltransferase [Nesterenkonia sp.]
MTEEDVPAVAALEQVLFPVDAWPERFFRQELSQTGTRRYWVAEGASDDGAAQLLGYVGLMCVPPFADVQTLAVARAGRRRGLGRLLLRTLIEEGRDRGAEQVLLEVRIDNHGAQHLYRGEGFSVIHTRRGYYRDGCDALIMRLPLADLEAPTSASRLRSPDA